MSGPNKYNSADQMEPPLEDPGLRRMREAEQLRKPGPFRHVVRPRVPSIPIDDLFTSPEGRKHYDDMRARQSASGNLVIGLCIAAGGFFYPGWYLMPVGTLIALVAFGQLQKGNKPKRNNRKK